MARTTRPSLLAAAIRGVGGMEPVPSGDQPAFGAATTLGGRWQRSQIASAALPDGTVDSHQRGRSSPPARRRWSTDPDGAGPRGLVPPARTDSRTRADLQVVTIVRGRAERVAGGTSSRRLSGGLMLVTRAGGPLRRPTSDPASRTDFQRRMFPRRAPDRRAQDQDDVLSQLTAFDHRLARGDLVADRRSDTCPN